MQDAALAGHKHVSRAGLGGLALLLCACASEPEPPAPATPDEARALADAEEMITAGRPDASTKGDRTSPGEPPQE